QVDLVAEPLQHPHGRLAHVREHPVDKAGDEQPHPHPPSSFRPVHPWARSVPPRHGWPATRTVPLLVGSYRVGGAVARISARNASRLASPPPARRAPSAPWARAWTSTLPRAVASAGPASTGSPSASA